VKTVHGHAGVCALRVRRIVKQIEEPRIEVMHIAGAVIAEKVIELIKGLWNVRVAALVHNAETLACLMNKYIRYYHEDRTHLGLNKQTPTGRKAATGVAINAKSQCCTCGKYMCNKHVCDCPLPDGEAYPQFEAA
jgi:hypothetical protein